MSDTPRMKAAQMAAMEHMTGDVYRVGCDIEQQINAANDRIKRLEDALSRIANQDYRGNRSTESQIAFNALKEAKL